MLYERARYLRENVLQNLMKGERPEICPFDLTITDIKEELDLEHHLLGAFDRQLAHQTWQKLIDQSRNEPETFQTLLDNRRKKLTTRQARDEAIFHAVVYKEVSMTLEAKHWELSTTRVGQIVMREVRRRQQALAAGYYAYPLAKGYLKGGQVSWDVCILQRTEGVKVLHSHLTLTQAFRKADELNSEADKRK